MIDAEDEPGNTGYNGPLAVADLVGFAAEYRALGGICWGSYTPFWYWSGAMGAPHTLDQLPANGLHLVSSNYPNAGYTDNGPGWAPYYPGAPVPSQWQYTSTPIDMNAFKGTVDDFAALIGTPRAEKVVTRMPFLARDDATGGVYLCTDDFKSHWIRSPDAVDRILALHFSGARRLGTAADGISPGDWIDWGTSKGVIRAGWEPLSFGPIATPEPEPVPVALTDTDRQAIIDGVAAALTADVNGLETREAAAAQAAADALKPPAQQEP